METAPEHTMLGGGSPFGCTTVENVTDKQRYSKEITIDDVARALEADGQRPKKWGAWLMFRCPNGAAHKNRDRKPSAGARISAQGNLVTSCMTCHQNELVRDYINGLLGIGNYTHFRSSTFTNPDDRNRDDVDDQTKIRLAQRDFDLAYPIPDRQDSPPRLWLAEKCGFYGRVPDAIKWEPDVKNDMIGSIIAMLAPLQAWTDAYPDVPDLTAVHRVGINAEGRKAFGFYLEGEWQDKKSRGVMVGSMVFIGDATSRSIVRVTEGVADALAVYGRWRQPTVALCGTAGLMNGKIARDLAGYDEVIIHADGDSPGKTPALKLRDKIREFGGTAYAFAPARGKDPADALGEIGEPLHGDDPDDAFWKSAQSPRDGGVGSADAAGVGGLEKGLLVQWDRLERAYEFDTLLMPGRHSGSCASGSSDGTAHNFQNAYFAPPTRTDDMRCKEPYGERSNLPQGEIHWEPFDCRKCPPCRAWWRNLQAERFFRMGEGKAILEVECPDLIEAWKWRKAQADRLDVQCVQVVDPTVRAARVTTIYFGDVTERDINNTFTNMVKRGLEGTFVSRTVSTSEFRPILPLEKRVEAKPGKKIDTMSWSNGIPPVKHPPKPRTYLKGDPELVDEYLPPERVTYLPEKYRKRKGQTDEGFALMCAVGRMSRTDLVLYGEDFIQWSKDIVDGTIRNITDLRDELADYGEYGGDAYLIHDCASWYAGIGEYRMAYGPVLEVCGLISDDTFRAMGVDIPEPPPCRGCGSRHCIC